MDFAYISTIFLLDLGTDGTLWCLILLAASNSTI